jgi:hypothetical protein
MWNPPCVKHVFFVRGIFKNKIQKNLLRKKKICVWRMTQIVVAGNFLRRKVKLSKNISMSKRAWKMQILWVTWCQQHQHHLKRHNVKTDSPQAQQQNGFSSNATFYVLPLLIWCQNIFQTIIAFFNQYFLKFPHYYVTEPFISQVDWTYKLVFHWLFFYLLLI